MNKDTLRIQLCMVFLCLSFVLPSDNLKKKVLNSVKSFHSTFPVEKVYLHTDKPFYAQGENIWLKAYLVDGMYHRFAAPSQNLYVELISPEGEIIQTITLENSTEGLAGDFALKDEMAPGTYILRAYTRSMQNFPDHFFFQKEIRIYDQQPPPSPAENLPDPQTPSEFEIHFFPEGGDLVNGLNSRVGFKITGENGDGIQDVEGKVFDDSGKFIMPFKSLKFGFGVFNLAPEAGKSYYAEVTCKGITRRITLPGAKSEGYTIAYMPGKDQKLYLTLESSLPGGLKGALLYGHLRGNSFLAEPVTTDLSKVTYEVPADSVTEGVAHLTLFDPQGVPVCERLVFIQKPDRKTRLTARTDKPSYGQRSRVKLSLQLTAEGNNADIKGADISVSVTDQSLVPYQPYGADIRSYLLLTSELKGRIEQPSYYFDPANPGAAFLLDLLMMTQGWRRFRWDQILAKDLPDAQFLTEQSFTISGQVIKTGEPDKSLQAKVLFNTLDENLLTGETITKEDGRFAFTGLAFTDTTRVVIRAQKHRKNKRETDSPEDRKVEILLDQPQIPPISGEWVARYYDRPPAVIEQYLEAQQEAITSDPSDVRHTVNLDTVSIKAKKAEKQDQPRQIGQLYNRPDYRLVLDSIGPSAYAYPTIFDLLQARVAGVQVLGEFPNQEVQIRGITSLSGSNAALFVVDGIMIDGDGVNSINVQDVDYIDVLKSNATAAIYGGRAATGVIVVYTKKGQNRTSSPDTRPRTNIVDFRHPGYYQAREFYAPNYDRKLPEHIRPDIRTTLHWNPAIRTDKAGKAELEFYTDDKHSTYRVDVQGVTADGTPLSAKTVFTIEK